MENEIMNYENEAMETEVEVVETENEKSGIGVGKFVLIAAAAAVATNAIVKWGKKAWAKHKAKKELHLVGEDEVVEPTEEQIEEVAAK